MHNTHNRIITYRTDKNKQDFPESDSDEAKKCLSSLDTKGTRGICARNPTLLLPTSRFAKPA